MVHPSCLVGVLTSDGFLYYHDTFYLSVYVELGATAAVPCDSAPLHNTKALSKCLLAVESISLSGAKYSDHFISRLMLIRE